MVLRSALTHPASTEHVRDTLGHQIEQIAAAMPEPDTTEAELRAALIVTLMLGVSIQRHLIQLPPVDKAETHDILRLLRPSVEALIGEVPRPDHPPQPSGPPQDGPPPALSRAQDRIGRPAAS